MRGARVTRFALVVGLGLLLVDLANAGVLSNSFNGVNFGTSVDEVHQKLVEHSDEIRVISVDPPVIPAAETSEVHLIVLGYATGPDSRIEEVAFVFGDSVLVAVEARGGAVEALTLQASGDAMSFEDYNVYLKDLMVAAPSQDAVWLLTQETLHPHMFLWSNTNLPSVEGRENGFNSSAARPSFLKFGRRIDQVYAEMDTLCAMITVDEIDEPWLATKPKKQAQINCYGYDFAGFPRKFEAVFGDGRLEQVWILTGAGEMSRVRHALIREYGEPIFVSDNYEFFSGWRVALRKDRPEVLMLSEKLSPIYRERFQREQ